MTNKKDNIILIGMPGSGKSTCGVLAAKALCMDFLDTDLLIQSREQMPLQTIINTKGPGYFSDAEEQALLSIRNRNCVIATGGSAVYYENAMEFLKQDGMVVYLQISLEEMRSRIRNITTRGILLRDGETLEDMYHIRESLYRQYADITIECDHQTVEQVVEEICALVKIRSF